jgi:uncharacterized membrane protein
MQPREADMKIAVWIVSGLLALWFLYIGGMKLLIPADVMAQTAPGFVVVLFKIAGVAEVLGAIGLILPAATRIVPILTPLAASGLVLVMIGAAIMEISMGLFPIQPIILGLLAAFVAWARFTDPVEPARRRRRPEEAPQSAVAH